VWQPKWDPSLDWTERNPDGSRPSRFNYAPWRSLIFRNVATPFPYTDDYALYPHMPMDAPGYDCRAKRILGQWMVSIPGVRQRADIDEYQEPYPNDVPPTAADDSPQPYVEVKPDGPNPDKYKGAVQEAQERLAIFQSGARTNFGEVLPAGYVTQYSMCPESADIIDPNVDGTCNLVPADRNLPPTRVPSQAHWVKLDLTQFSTFWVPRRSDWSDVLKDGVIPPAGFSLCPGNDAAKIAASEKQTLDMLTNVRIDNDPAFKALATTEVPFGLWKENQACDWSTEPWKSNGTPLDQIHITDPRPWMDAPSGTDLDANRAANGADAGMAIASGVAHVYKASYGAAVFNQICVNCHGPQFDSVGRLAENLSAITGGVARVANLRDGLFGPVGTPGANRASVFPSPTSPDDPTVDDWGARYLAWMALGGTKVPIPRAFMGLVTAAPFFGRIRGIASDAANDVTLNSDANMLTVAQGHCVDVLESTLIYPPITSLAFTGFDYFSDRSRRSLLWTNGDAEMWLKLCSFNNPAPVRIVQFDYLGDAGKIGSTTLLKREVFESRVCAATPNQPCLVGDQNNSVGPLTPQNPLPWCLMPNTGISHQSLANWAQTRCVGGSHCVRHACTGQWPDPECVYPPRCPDGILAPDGSVVPFDYDALKDHPEYSEDAMATVAKTWARRGAVNAGLSVFLYLDGVMHGKPVKPAYDRCDQIAQ
jgi:hypothetical protein